jgi:hypothetical protein
MIVGCLVAPNILIWDLTNIVYQYDRRDAELDVLQTVEELLKDSNADSLPDDTKDFCVQHIHSLLRWKFDLQDVTETSILPLDSKGRPFEPEPNWRDCLFWRECSRGPYSKQRLRELAVLKGGGFLVRHLFPPNYQATWETIWKDAGSPMNRATRLDHWSNEMWNYVWRLQTNDFKGFTASIWLDEWFNLLSRPTNPWADREAQWLSSCLQSATQWLPFLSHLSTSEFLKVSFAACINKVRKLETLPPYPTSILEPLLSECNIWHERQQSLQTQDPAKLTKIGEKRKAESQ